MASAPVRSNPIGQILTRIFYQYIVFILLGCLCLGASIALAGTAYLSNQLVESQALQQAQATTRTVQQAEQIHRQAQSNTSESLAGSKDAGSSYWVALSQRLQGQQDNFFRAYSASADSRRGRPSDSFGQQAQTYLEKHPQQAYTRQDEIAGHRYFRYASTVENADGSRQVLEINQSIEQALRTTQRGLWWIGLALMGVSSLILGSVTFMLRGLRQLNQNLKTQIQLQRQEHSKVAPIDGLTQVATRRQFHVALEEEWRRMRRRTQDLSLILCQVDFFGEFQSTYGEQAAEVCLRIIAQSLSSHVHRIGDLVARYDQSSFAILLPHTNELQAVQIVAKLSDAIYGLKIEHRPSPVNARVTISMGVATLIPSAHRDSDQLLNRATSALSAAQQQGHNRFVVHTPSSTEA
ncbi:MAG: GGDEF domain-containing protein [Thermosynechococcaceae cyanobacterium]